MNIGIDIDDVLADFVGGWIPFHNHHEKTDLSVEDVFDYDLRKVLDVSLEEVVRRIYHFYDSEEFGELSPIKDSIQSLQRFSQEHSLIVITSRPDTIEPQSRTWLETHYGNPFDEIVFTHQMGKYSEQTELSKTSICLKYKIDVLIEDAPEYCFDAAEAGVTVYMMDKPWNKDEKLLDNMKRVQGWKEIEELITNFS